MTEITRDQFLRGIEAINAHNRLVKVVYDAFAAAGEDRVDGLGASRLLNELSRQLEERCNDPNVPMQGSMIDYVLYEQGGLVIEADGSKRMVNTPELLWSYWEETGCGPFEATV
jgi:hypothetical protein